MAKSSCRGAVRRGNGVRRLAPAILLAALAGVVAPSRTQAATCAPLDHGPILISSDSDFTAANGVASGSGTAADPYVFNNLKLPGYNGLTGARFGWGARTGGLNDNHWIDDVQIAVGTVCPPALSIARNGNNVVVTFGGVLETATSITGPWTPLAGQGSPYTTPATDAARFFRSRMP